MLYIDTEIKSEKSLYDDFKIGFLFFTSGLLKKSLPYLKKALQLFLEKRDFSSYFSCCELMIQAFNELEEKRSARALKQEMEEVCKSYNIFNTARVLSCLAYHNIYIEENFTQAKQELNEALKIAFDNYDRCKVKGTVVQQSVTRFEIMRCLYVYSIYYFEIKDYKNCIQELKHLKIFIKDYFKLKQSTELAHSKTNNSQELLAYHNLLTELKQNFHNVQKIQLSVKFSEVLIAINYFKKYKQAERLLWEVYEEANKINNSFLVPYILCAMTYCCIKLKNETQARMFFHLAQKQVHKERKLLLRYMRLLKKQGNLSNSSPEDPYDIIFDEKDHVIIEKHKGCIELKNQFVLEELLKLFLFNPGVSFSKEEIIRKVWKQRYAPEVHDNKIYVTVKRLRAFIEKDSSKPRYICRTNLGYCFSKQVKVFIK